MNGEFLCVETTLSDCKILNIQTSRPIIDDPDYMDIKIQVDMYGDTIRNFFATIPNCSYKELCDFFSTDNIKTFNNVCAFLLMFIRKFSGRSCGKLHFSNDKFECFPETVSLNIQIGNGDIISKIDFEYEDSDRKMIESFIVSTNTNKKVCVEMDLSKYEWADEPNYQPMIWNNSVVRRLSYQEAKDVLLAMEQLHHDLGIEDSIYYKDEFDGKYQYNIAKKNQGNY
jgi:hypothetical protein